MYILVHVWSCLYKADIQAATTLLNIANVISFCRHYCDGKQMTCHQIHDPLNKFMYKHIFVKMA